MKKIIASSILLLLSLFVLTGCTSRSTETTAYLYPCPITYSSRVEISYYYEFAEPCLMNARRVTLTGAEFNGNYTFLKNYMETCEYSSISDGNYPIRGYMGEYIIKVFVSDELVLFSRLILFDSETITAEIEVCPILDGERATMYSIGTTTDSTIDTLVDYVYNFGTETQEEGNS